MTGSAGWHRTSEWGSPPWLVAELAAEFAHGHFDLDVAASAQNAKAPAFYTIEDDGLAQPWFGRCWCNPPYGYTDALGRHVGAWMTKAAAEVSEGRAELVVALVRASVDAGWWRAAIRETPG